MCWLIGHLWCAMSQYRRKCSRCGKEETLHLKLPTNVDNYCGTIWK